MRVLQDQRALKVRAAMKTRRQTEMPLEQRVRLAEEIQDVYQCLRFSSNSLRILLYSSAQLVSSVKLWFSIGYGATSQLSLRSSISRWTSRTESWKNTFV